MRLPPEPGARIIDKASAMALDCYVVGSMRVVESTKQNTFLLGQIFLMKKKTQKLTKSIFG